VVPDIQAALGRAQSQGKLPESGAPPGVSVPPGVPGAPTTGANASGTNATKPGNTTSAGGRKLLANDCFYTGFAGNRFLYQFDVWCVHAARAAPTQGSAQGSADALWQPLLPGGREYAVLQPRR
jgi:hypothetical protein